MSRFIESICCVDGQLLNLDLHQSRVDRTFAHYYDTESFLLADNIKTIPESGKHKCRVLYDDSNLEMEFNLYEKRPINSLKIVDGGAIDYKFKSENRNKLDELHKQRGDCDDIIIVKEGLVTDSYYANLAFYDGTNWLTPSRPLLKGIGREKLIVEGLVREEEILVKDIYSFSQVSLINAMLELGEVVVPIGNIKP